VVHINAQHFANEQLHVLGVAVGVVVRAGIAHAEVEEAVRPELEAAAAVVLRHAGNLDEAPGGQAGVMLEVGGELALDDGGGDLAVLDDLVLQIILPIFAKFRMEGQSRRPLGRADRTRRW